MNNSAKKNESSLIKRRGLKNVIRFPILFGSILMIAHFFTSNYQKIFKTNIDNANEEFKKRNQNRLTNEDIQKYIKKFEKERKQFEK